MVQTFGCDLGIAVCRPDLCTVMIEYLELDVQPFAEASVKLQELQKKLPVKDIQTSKVNISLFYFENLPGADDMFR